MDWVVRSLIGHATGNAYAVAMKIRTKISNIINITSYSQYHGVCNMLCEKSCTPLEGLHQ